MPCPSRAPSSPGWRFPTAGNPPKTPRTPTARRSHNTPAVLRCRKRKRLAHPREAFLYPQAGKGGKGNERSNQKAAIELAAQKNSRAATSATRPSCNRTQGVIPIGRGMNGKGMGAAGCGPTIPLPFIPLPAHRRVSSFQNPTPANRGLGGPLSFVCGFAALQCNFYLRTAGG